MNVACWQDERFGPAFVALAPATDREPPETAKIPQCPRGPATQLASRGHAVSWDDWVQRLSERVPVPGRWTSEEVPDGLSARQALSFLREKSQRHSLSS